MADIRRQFSLDYLTGGRETGGSQEGIGSRALDEAVVVYSQPILKRLSAADKQQMYIHDLVRKVSEEISIQNFEEFLAVINRLAALKFIEILEKDVTGNHLVHLLRRT